MDTGNEPPKIPPRGENVFHWERDDIEDAFAPLDSSKAQAAASEYATVASNWDQGLETFSRSVLASIAEAWEGASADQAKNAITRYTTDAHKLTDLLAQMADDMMRASQAIRDTRLAIPLPAAHSWTANIYLPRAAEEERSKNDVRDAARTVMQDNYVKPFAELDARVPVLPTALDLTQTPGTSSPGPSATSTETSRTPTQTSTDTNRSGQSGTSDPSDQSNKDETGDKSDETAQDTSKDSTSKDSQTTPSNVTSKSPTSTDPSTTPATTPNTTPTNPTSTNPTSTHGPSSPTSTGSPGRDNPVTASPGRSLTGVTGPGTPTATASTAATTSVSRGTTGMPGMMGGAGRGKSEEDSTHKTAEYLVNAENTEELLGEAPRTVEGGVIGGERG